MTLEIHQFPCLFDNYGYLLHDKVTGNVAAIDTPDVDVINKTLFKKGWHLTYIFNTHHHPDHTGGNLALKEKWQCEIIGPRAEAQKIPGIDRQVEDGDEVMLGESKAIVYDTPGHTLGHIIYHFADDWAAFVGDTIFALGCGRLFEGTPAQMWASLSKIMTLPTSTKLFCAHEYTQANAKFALSIDPDNQHLKQRSQEIDELRAVGKPTVPTTVSAELATNPFLRVGNPSFRQSLNMVTATDVDVFAEVRRRKDQF